MDIKSNMLLITFILVSCTMLIGCSARKEIEKLFFVRTVGIDKGAQGTNKVRLTITTGVTNQTASKGELQKKAKVLYAEGKTVFDAVRNFRSFSEKDIFWGHSQYIILGEIPAKENALEYLDFFIRNHENRLNAIPAVLIGTTGSDLIQSFGNNFIDDELDNLYSNAGDLSRSKKITIAEFIEKLNNQYSSAYIPCIHAYEKEEKDDGKNTPQKDITLDGYAVFKGKKLLDCITGKSARGLNWITGDVKSGIIIVKDAKGNDISLEIINTGVKIKTDIEDNVPSVTVKVRADSNIGEIEGQLDVSDKHSIVQLEKQQTDIIKGEIENAIYFAKQNDVDILGFGDKLFHQHPVKWEGIKDNWDTLFPKINVNVEVESKINRSYNIGKPIRDWEEKNK